MGRSLPTADSLHFPGSGGGGTPGDADPIGVSSFTGVYLLDGSVVINVPVSIFALTDIVAGSGFADGTSNFFSLDSAEFFLSPSIV